MQRLESLQTVHARSVSAVVASRRLQPILPNSKRTANFSSRSPKVQRTSHSRSFSTFFHRAPLEFGANGRLPGKGGPRRPYITYNAPWQDRPPRRRAVALPLYRKPVFAGFYQTLQIDDEAVFEALIKLKTEGQDIIAAFMTEKPMTFDEGNPDAEPAIRRDAGSVESWEALRKVGCTVRIVNFMRLPQLTSGGHVIISAQERVRLEGPAASDEPHGAERASDEPRSAQRKQADPPGTTEESISVEKEIQDQQIPVPAESSADAGRNAFSLFRRTVFDSFRESRRQQRERKFVKIGRLPTSADSNVDIPVHFRQKRKNELTNGGGIDMKSADGQAGLMTATDSAGSGNSNNSVGPLFEVYISDALEKNYMPSLTGRVMNVSARSAGLEGDFLEDSGPDAEAAVAEEIRGLHLELASALRQLIKVSHLHKEHYDQFMSFYDLDSPPTLAVLMAAVSFADRNAVQAVVEEEDFTKRMRSVLEIAKKDYEFSDLQMTVKQRINERMIKDRRRSMLMEQLKVIRSELGLQKDDKQAIVEKLHEAVKGKVLPQEAIDSLAQGVERLYSLDFMSLEFNICSTHLEWLTGLPWDSASEENRDIAEAERCLNENHYGLTDVKNRLLEFIAVGVLKGGSQGKIICLVGPPGVGKTSVGRAVAKALGRKFYHFSLGGLSDVAELRGHRRTYVGAMPGRIVQALKTCQTSNPVILLDEIDKLSRDYRGDPSAALLEILDGEQNSYFRDYYLDVPIDLSHILFICTANSLENIDETLLNRLEILKLPGYLAEEKAAIAKQFLIPQALTACGVAEETIEVEDGVVEKLVNVYTREAGVRTLLQLVERIFRKAALEIVRGASKISVGVKNLTDYLGQPAFDCGTLYKSVTPPGVVRGLAWTALGGKTLYVEAVGRATAADDRLAPIPSVDAGANDTADAPNPKETSKSAASSFAWPLVKPLDVIAAHASEIAMKSQRSSAPGSFKVTGQLGGVMTESSEIAMTVARRFLARTSGGSNRFLEQADIHLHVPEGATRKDGPSAGITMATALVSLATNRAVVPRLAMTGELSLLGNVMRVGGLKEKVLAAKRDGVEVLVLPAGNETQFNELAENIKSDLIVHFVSSFDEVCAIVFQEPEGRER